MLNQCFLHIETFLCALHLRNCALKITSECQLGYYGENCGNQCSENCNVTSRCDRFTGNCNRGCKLGWTGNTCDQSEYTVKKSKLPNTFHIYSQDLTVLIKQWYKYNVSHNYTYSVFLILFLFS